MAAAAIVAMIAQMVGGAVINGVTTAVSTNDKIRAYKKAAEDIRNATEQYSGVNEYNRMYQAGADNTKYAKRDLDRQVAEGDLTNNAMIAANNSDVNADYVNYYNQGAARQNALDEAAYNKATANAQREMNQADINYNAKTKAAQAGANAIGGIANLAAQMGTGKNTDTSSTSDENEKESPINNNSGLPKADIEDSLRQIETVSYKYKHPEKEGEDDLSHVGVTAQSLEKTPLFEECVSENEEGIKVVDKWRLQEALTAGLANMQREIDDLQYNNLKDAFNKWDKKTKAQKALKKRNLKGLHTFKELM